MKRTILIVVGLAVFVGPARAIPRGQPARNAARSATSAMPILHWSHQARRAIVPAGPNGALGAENYGNKFPGEAAVYMGIVHAAMYDAVVAIEGGYRAYSRAFAAPANTAADAAIATAAHRVLIGLQPALGLTVAQQATLDAEYTAYLAAIPDDPRRARGVALGEHVATAILAMRASDGRERNPQLLDLAPPAAGPGVWEPGSVAAVGLRMPGIRPLAIRSASQFRPDGPNRLASVEYGDDFQEVAAVGRIDSAARSEEETRTALFWTDHDLRQWNDALLQLARERHLNLLESARMLALAHVAGGDAMIACFDAKYAYWFWRPYQAIPGAGIDGNAATDPEPAWQPLATTPNFPEYPSAHACHSTAMAEALATFFGTDRVPFTISSRITGTLREYDSFGAVVREVNAARVLVGFHFRNSDEEGSQLGRRVAQYVVGHFFQPVGPHR
jgi:hypothetical protein